MDPTINVSVSIDLSALEIDWEQSVEIEQMGVFHDEWTLRDPDSDTTVSGESYMDARRRLTWARDVGRRAEQAAERQVQREMHRTARRCMSMEVM